MGMTKAKKNLLHNYPVDRDANGNYLCSWCTNGTQTTRNKWIDHVHDKHFPQFQRILNQQREKKRQETKQRLEAEEAIDNAILKMDQDDDDDEDSATTTTTTTIHSSQKCPIFIPPT
ncbi:unnamed protein product [Rotaria sordida]|uniref:Uncharacterized protein n=1 Tax=Rotaria sordida TaxID=392033 RepID=A0A815WDD8_9BILA|nr:unnamed protein product [Rotaria sordida]CAF1541798.1 unnamed protein product [Rotaria sordida]